MTTSFSEFSDIATNRLEVPSHRRRGGICGPLVRERGTRSYGVRLAQSGWTTLGHLDKKTVEEVLKRVNTTRPNFDKVLYCLKAAGVVIFNQ